MLLNSFFKITEVQGHEKYLVKIELCPEHKIYEGHFPGNPIVPGVCLTQMVKETVELQLKKETTLVSANSIKFTAVLNPNNNTHVSMELQLQEESPGLWQVSTKLFEEETTFFSFKGKLKKNEKK